MVFDRWLARFRRSSVPVLGELEARLLAAVWDGGEVSVRDLHHRHAGTLAYTTVMTTLDRLYKKGLLNRRKEGRAFYYSAAMSRADFSHALARRAVAEMMQWADSGAVLSSFVSAVGESDAKLLDDLERLVHSHRKAKGQQP